MNFHPKPRIADLSAVERLIVANQFEILALFDKENSKDLSFKAKILKGGHTFFYSDVFSGLSSVEVPYEICQEVVGILRMYREINNFRSSSLLPWIGLSAFIEFKGFPPHQYGWFMDFLIDNTDYFPDFKHNKYYLEGGKELKAYQAMLKKYKELKWTNDSLDKNGYDKLLKVFISNS
jgi:uncharacterized protein YfbU (UPF0304 family)